MNIIVITVILCLLAGCGGMQPVEGVPEMQIRYERTATVVVQPDGSRLVTVSQGEMVLVIILMPPLAAKSSPVTMPIIDKVEK
jgi:hypothetical protein